MSNSTPTAYTYSRASSNDKEDVSNSIPAQEKRTRAYYDMKLQDEGVQWGGSVCDKSTSASRYRFDERPGGKLLLEKLRPGDHLIFDKLDRMWRSVYDFERLHRYFEKHGIIWHVVNQSGVAIDTSGAAGKAMVTVMIAFAELEAGMASERQKASIRHRREQGRPINKPRIGMKSVKKVVDGVELKFLEWDNIKRTTMRAALRMVMNAESIQDAYDDFCEMVARQQGRAFCRTYVTGRPLGLSTLRNWCGAELMYQALEAEGFTTAAEVQREIHERGWKQKDFARKAVPPKAKPRGYNLMTGEKKPRQSDQEKFEKLLGLVRGDSQQ